jgi:hypothetical protein
VPAFLSRYTTPALQTCKFFRISRLGRIAQQIDKMQKNLQQAYAHKQILIYNYTLGFKTFLIMTAIIHISACTFMYICTDNGMIGDDFDGYYTLYDYDITDPV